MTRTIDLTPTWRQAATIIAAALENGTDTGREAARAELFRMAELMDQLADTADMRLGVTTGDQHYRLGRALNIAGEALDLGAMDAHPGPWNREPDARDAIERLWQMWTQAKPEADA